MATYTYNATYTVVDRQIFLSTDGTQTLASLAGQKSYMSVMSSRGGVPLILDMTKYFLWQPGLVFTTSLSATAASLTDLQVSACVSQDIPQQDHNTGGYPCRLDVYDATTASDVQIAWTSVTDIASRNDIYQKDTMNDLVLTPMTSTRSFANVLVSVNGVFQQTYYFNKELYVQGGFANIRNVNRADIVVYDTTTLGGHTILPITPQNIDASNAHPLSGVTLTYPNLDFTNVTLLFVCGGYLHLLDDTYHLINKNRLKIDICKLDLINEFLHNPMTQYSLDTIANNVAAQTQDAPFAPPTVANDITHYLSDVYLQEQTGTGDVAFLTFAPVSGTVPAVTDDIAAFLMGYPLATLPNQVMFANYVWSASYQAVTDIVTTRLMSVFTDPNYIYTMLIRPDTFLVVINNTKLYKRTYRFVRLNVPGQYESYGSDMPRGVVQYNRSMMLSPLLYSEQSLSATALNLSYEKTYRDVYKTILNPITIPSPVFDVQEDRPGYPVEMIELYAAAS